MKANKLILLLALSRLALPSYPGAASFSFTAGFTCHCDDLASDGFAHPGLMTGCCSRQYQANQALSLKIRKSNKQFYSIRGQQLTINAGRARMRSNKAFGAAVERGMKKQKNKL